MKHPLQAILDIEDTDKILDFYISDYDFPLWLYIRHDIFQYLFYNTFNYDLDVPISNPKRVSNKKIFFSFLKDIITPWAHRDVWYLSNISQQFYKRVDEEFIDIYNDTFAKIFPQKSLYISQSLFASRAIAKNDYPYKFIQSAMVLFGKFSKHLVTVRYKKTIYDLITYLKERTKNFSTLLNETYWHGIEKKLIFRLGFSIAQYHFFELLYKHTKPKILVITDSYYGRPDIISQSKRHGIITLELQHGAVSLVHPAYNWAESICKSPKIRNYVVDYFLTYGNFWHSRMQLPGRCVEIGSPWFSEQSRKDKQDGNAILFCLGIHFNIFEQIIQKIVTSFPQKKIIIRYHPRTKNIFLSSAIKDLKEIYVDHNDDIYKSLSQSEIIIGDTSTALYEALALGKRVFSLKSKVSVDFFRGINICFFTTGDELVELIKDKSSARLSWNERESLYCNNPQENYGKFITKILTTENRDV